MIFGVEAEEPDQSFFITDREPGCGAGCLRPDDGPAPRRGSVDRVGAARHLGNRDRLGVDAVREPARIRHLVDRVQVLRPDVRRRVAGPCEEVHQEVGGQIDIPLLDLRRVLRLWLAGDWIVVVEPWGRAACGKRESRETGGQDDESERQFAHVRMGRLRRTRASSLQCLEPRRASGTYTPGGESGRRSPSRS